MAGSAGAAQRDGTVVTQRVQVIGVLSDNTTVTEDTVHVNDRVIAALTGKAVQPETFYVKAAAGADVRTVAQEVERTFPSSALDAKVIVRTASPRAKPWRGAFCNSSRASWPWGCWWALPPLG